MRPNDLALLRIPGVPAVSPDGRMAVVAVTPARPGGRRVPEPAVGGADRRVGVRPAADLRAPRQRAGVLPGRPLAGLPQRRARRQAAGLAAADRRGRAPPAHRPPPRRRCAGLGAGLAGGWPTSARVPEQGRYGTVDGRRPGRRAAAADHHAEVPPGRRRLPDRPAQPGLRARPAGRTSPTTPRRCRSRSR